MVPPPCRGKRPANTITYDIASDGWILLRGWLPPVEPVALSGGGSECVCAGICCTSSDTCEEPVLSPGTQGLSPDPCPISTALIPLKSGKAKLVWPSPPKVVPITTNSASLLVTLKSWPWQNVHPAGSMFPANRQI